MQNFLDTLAGHVLWFNDRYWYLVIALLVIAGIYFSIRTFAVQIRFLPEMFRSVVERPGGDDAEQGVSAFRAFTVSAASRVGTGNIAGVALAISVGGPGAVFWMWLLAVMGGATAFVESSLAQLYKVRGKDGFVGGPAYYIRYALRQPWLATLFAVIITVTYGFVFNAVQSNSISDSVQANVGESTTVAVVTGAVVAVLTAAVIFGGIRRLSSVTKVIVPVMAVSYIVIALIVVLINITEVPAMIALIVGHALGFEQVTGAAFGAALMQGMRRGLFSNEAGMGSVPNAAATAAVSHPVKQGLTQSLGVYFDTIIVCSATAFIILLSNPSFGSENVEGVSLTQSALEAQLGGWVGPFLTVVIFFLAWSSILGNYFYGQSNIEYLAGERARPWILAYRLLVVLCVFGGALGSVALIWNVADLFMGFMATINLIAIIPLGGLAVKMLKDYERQRALGLNPVFRASSLPEARGVSLWREGETEAMQLVSKSD
ncbi:AGCS family alanine or glycine:cation symporter [Citricoccus muralis]|uniref:AGCS family alanine or glycine:cation symporter n=1 Tax=Citricoccus muralis TaxID=169134 RepID=A0A3D9LDQ4_9MICC|nr:alanine/glycine:cation symporter family protein [Citricoccus muralis]REE04272.1 AGCS family alanine or glycine:cation symporter [Citricoccus muralis]